MPNQDEQHAERLVGKQKGILSGLTHSIAAAILWINLDSELYCHRNNCATVYVVGPLNM